MEGKGTEKLGTDLIGKLLLKFNDEVDVTECGQAYGIFTDMIDGEEAYCLENYLYKRYLKSYDLLQFLQAGPGSVTDLIEDTKKDMEEEQRGRAHIQAYKIKHGIELDTPLCFHDSVLDELVQGNIAKPAMER